MNGATPGGSAWLFWKQVIFEDLSFDNAQFDFDKDTERALATKIGNSTLPKVYDEKVDISSIKAHVAVSLFSFRGGQIQQSRP